MLALELDNPYLAGYRDVIAQLVNRATETMGPEEVLDRLKCPEPADGLEQLIRFEGDDSPLRSSTHSAAKS